MKEIDITKRQPSSLGDSCLVFKTTPETDICFSCDPNKKCNGDCKRFREEMKKLKKKRK
jgi:hypothetical protein